jgi:mono/diheme cytochrome c family protein
MRITFVVIIAAVATLGGVWLLWPVPADPVADAPVGAPLVAVSLPATLTDREQMGATAFAANCAACHGDNAAGRNEIGPPLIHKIYEPSHHADYSFERAVQYGVQSHHWPFGNMVAVEGLTTADIVAITAYVRAVQRANGIN